MKRLEIRQFGPIVNCDIEIRRVTVFIGNQGTGKSTVAKLISIFSWIEKALVRGDFSTKELVQYNRFQKKYCAYQKIENYFKKGTLIKYTGRAYSFKYSEGKLSVTANESKASYLKPQIMYVPAERNFLSAVEKPTLLKNLPSALYTFLDEYESAERELKGTPLSLPINSLSFQYDRLNKTAWVVGDGYKIKLTESSSGIQSLVPLFLVTKYLAQTINESHKEGLNVLSVDEKNRISSTIKKILGDKEITGEVRDQLLRQLSSLTRNHCFLNIVEEPEQNLFPSSQKSILFELLSCANSISGNELIMTTHSPYVIMYTTLAIQAKELADKIASNSGLCEKLYKIVPAESHLAAQDVVVYQIDATGSVSKLPFVAGLPSDENYLNGELVLGNELFDSLIEIESEWQK